MVPDTFDAIDWLRKHLEADDNDLIREMVGEFAQRLMSAEADASCGAGYGEGTTKRLNSRNDGARRNSPESLTEIPPGERQAALPAEWVRDELPFVQRPRDGRRIRPEPSARPGSKRLGTTNARLFGDLCRVGLDGAARFR